MHFRFRKKIFIYLVFFVILIHIIMIYKSSKEDAEEMGPEGKIHSLYHHNNARSHADEADAKEMRQTLKHQDETDPNSILFKSYENAQLYMKSVQNLKHSHSKIIIQYSNFSRHLPRFINDKDYELFMRSERNLGNLKSQGYDLLRGVVEIVPNATFKMDYECGFQSDSSYLKIPRKPNYSFNFLVPLVIPMGFLFQHFFDGTFPKIVQALEYIQNHPEVKVLIEQPFHKNTYSILNKLGLTKDRIVWHKRSDSQTVYHADVMLFTCVAPPLHPTLWRTMRTILGVNQILDIPFEKSLVIYLTRKGASNGGRRAVNEADVIKFLHSRYKDRFLIFNGTYTLDEAVSIFGRAGVIIGTHGGAFYNMNYAPVNTTVIEYVPVLKGGADIPSLPHAIFWATADLLGQTYWRVPAFSVNRQHDMNIDLEKLEQILKQVEIDSPKKVKNNKKYY